MSAPSVPASRTATSLRQQALDALLLTDPDAKMAQTHALWAELCQSADDGLLAQILRPEESLGTDEARLPGRPAQPELVLPGEVPQRSPFIPEGLAALLHAIAHIEFNAINLGLDAVWRFSGMPLDFYRDWLRVADEEATHFQLLRDELRQIGADYGDFPAHNGLWEMCVKTRHDVTARMALVPRTLEARGLDATPLIQARLRKVGSPAAMRAIAVLDIILRDEVGHVAIGNHWYGWLCQQQQIAPLKHYRTLARQHEAPRLRPPFNLDARSRAGFSEEEIAYLHGDGQSPAAD